MQEREVRRGKGGRAECEDEVKERGRGKEERKEKRGRRKLEGNKEEGEVEYGEYERTKRTTLRMTRKMRKKYERRV